jgi:hypothetical protein
LPFKSRRHRKLVKCCGEINVETGLQDRTGFFAPIRLIKIDGEKIASVVDQQWIHAGGDLAPEMLANDGVGDRRRGANTQAFPSSCLSSELDRYPPSRERVVGRI